MKSRSPYVLQLDDDCLMTISLCDPYWTRLLARHFVYEPELEMALYALRDKEYGFLDGGANYGYWSIKVSSSRYGSKIAVAVEPSSSTFERLAGYFALNKSRFICVRRALSCRSQEQVLLCCTDNHAGSYVAGGDSLMPGQSDSAKYELVRTATVDEIVYAHFPPDLPRLVLKLDLEGHEQQAMAGARQALTRETLVVYEDHGSDRGSRTTACILNDHKMSVYFIDNRGRIRQVRTVGDAGKIKRHRSVGYNFFACSPRGEFECWLSSACKLRLLSARPNSSFIGMRA